MSDTTNIGRWVGDEAGRTGALGPVVDNMALGVGSTGGGTVATGVHASVVDAGIGLGAVSVGPAANYAHLVETHMPEETVIVNAAGHWK